MSHGRVCKQYITRSCNISLFKAMRFDEKSFHMPGRKRRQKGLRVSTNDIMAVKGLKALRCFQFRILHVPDVERDVEDTVSRYA